MVRGKRYEDGSWCTVSNEHHSVSILLIGNKLQVPRSSGLYFRHRSFRTELVKEPMATPGLIEGQPPLLLLLVRNEPNKYPDPLLPSLLLPPPINSPSLQPPSSLFHTPSLIMVKAGMSSSCPPCSRLASLILIARSCSRCLWRHWPGELFLNGHGSMSQLIC